MDDEVIRKFYSEYALGEWNRLVKSPYHRLEFDTSMHFLNKYLLKGGLF
jgi:hypothetical protein